MNKTTLRDFSLLLALTLLVGYFSLASGGAFVSARNLSNLGVEFAITAVLALGVFLVLLPGQTDLSTGSGVGLAGGVAAVLLFKHGWPAPAAMVVATLCCLLAWGAMGWLVVRQRIPAFIITLAGMLVFRGLHWLVIGNETIPVRIGSAENLLSVLTTWYLPAPMAWVAVALVGAWLGWAALTERRLRRQHQLPLEHRDNAFTRWFISLQLLLLLVVILNQFNGVPLPVLVLGVLAALVNWLTRHTRLGRHLYAIGGNREAARLSGIRVERTILAAFLLCGGAVALTGFLQTAYGGGSTTTVGTLMELDAIAACVIGGVSLTGGTGRVSGVLFGALLMAVVLNGMTLLAVSPELKQIARGLVLAVAVWMDVSLARRRAAV
jgi:D-xylose transport system permease protein